MQITFIDTEESWKQMLPLSYTRPVAEVRVGILKVHEKWSKRFSTENIFFRSEDYFQNIFLAPTEKTLTILGNVLPTEKVFNSIKELKEDEALSYQDQIIAGYYDKDESFDLGNRKAVQLDELHQVAYPWDIFRVNGSEIKKDFDLLTKGRKSEPINDQHTKTYGDQIFLEKGAKVKAAVLNAENGPIYIGKDAEVQEGALIRGPFALCEHSTINMGAKIKGDSTIGPHCKVGGEVSNSVIFGYSNKGHEGFLGNSVIGEWCNLGADTNNSNLKNNYANVKMWDFATGGFKDTGLQFCGLIMGDHSKCGINTMFNTGTTVGVSANIFGDGFPRTIIPSFAWGGSSGFTTYQTRKAFETAELVMKRRSKDLTEADKAMLSHIFEITAENRVWEKK
ncbi:UDP-N-acetylglucosamine diphosphorylase/glucosamine-1-phosphate N-acetyltransferase [Ekhidna lutea]|uniref:UDP-N-acetylglucosamine diphosphorylase/glucosamine-1-phosphate N-acetyltransferase n=1 Tax=Ekhidna lutea TaxID=447679 RepID=A0A239EZT8_EKHLU|nr:GlmU family protein [Ekhidna lutea]SNS49808.1 UDP-N-acetylglucosamine diphosphorylase/glucosamine-1-phosphate N-acetyltransferase [Ekhidna lutea]